jgi:hypothetical protein
MEQGKSHPKNVSLRKSIKEKITDRSYKDPNIYDKITPHTVWNIWWVLWVAKKKVHKISKI